MFNWFRKNRDTEVKYLIVGLGNIGVEYNNTRHNIGFDVLDHWASKLEVEFESGRLAFVAKAKFRGKQIVLIKPTTFMNLSGKSVAHWMKKENIPVERTLIITDDLTLPVGKIRLKTKGSHAGHNGLKDIIAQLGDANFPRLKFGIGDDFPRGRQVEHVLGKWKDNERTEVEIATADCPAIIEAFIIQGAERTMNQFN